MATPGWIELFVTRLEAVGLSYMVTGSVASMVYGEPRLTLDVDVVLELQIDRAGAFLDAFPESAFYRPPLEVVRVEAGREARGHFNLIHHATGMKADIYLAASDALHRWGLAHRRRLALGAGAMWVAPPEYVIIRKLEFFREGGSEKHLRDVRAMLAAGLEVDRDFLAAELRGRGLGAEWLRVGNHA
ncbi:MAG: hypothetical protein H6Q91_3129 [Deltaproteobacteria bacterium]|jgi:hypothetical protein|nr:hypothetical protein [Deltaproteobacteria bacterium]